jgi:hypothetical protein
MAAPRTPQKTQPAKPCPRDLLKDPEEHKRWLRQHIPNRICAAAAGLEHVAQHFEGKWRFLTTARTVSGDDWAVKHPGKVDGKWAMDRSVEEGRKVAVRWLCEFVGVAACKGTVTAKPAKRLDESVHASDLVVCPGETIDITKQPKEAGILAKAWSGCTNGTTHPTIGAPQAAPGDPDIAAALKVILEHLQENLYDKQQPKLILLDVVLDLPEFLAEQQAAKENAAVAKGQSLHSI